MGRFSDQRANRALRWVGLANSLTAPRPCQGTWLEAALQFCPTCPPYVAVEGEPDRRRKARDRGNVAATCGKQKGKRKAASAWLNRFQIRGDCVLSFLWLRVYHRRCVIQDCHHEPGAQLDARCEILPAGEVKHI